MSIAPNAVVDVVDSGAMGFKIFNGAIRHKVNMETHVTKVRLYDAGVSQITIVRSGQAGTSTTNGTWTLNAYGYCDVTINHSVGSVSDGFYEVFVWHNGSSPHFAQVVESYETATVSWPELPAFASTVSLADWQALSDRADILAAVMEGAVKTPFPSYFYDALHRGADVDWRGWDTAPGTGGAPIATPPSGSDWSNCRGFIQHHGDYITFSLVFKMATNETTTIQFVVAGEAVAEYGYTTLAAELASDATTIQVGEPIFSPSTTVMTSWGERIALGTKASTYVYNIVSRNVDNLLSNQQMTEARLANENWVRHYFSGERTSDKEDKVPKAYYSGVIPVSGIAVGDVYELVIAKRHQSGGDDDGTSEVLVEFATEGPSAEDTMAGWQAMTMIAKDTVVTPEIMGPIRDNLQLLSDVVGYRNYATPNLIGNPVAGRNREAWFVRGHSRWLIYYRNDADSAQVQLSFIRGKTAEGKYRMETANLDLEPHKWMAYDLEGIQGLAPGTPYKVSGCQFVFEDQDVAGL